MKVLVRAKVNTCTGYGNDGIGLSQALLRLGADVHIKPETVLPPIPRDVAMLLSKADDYPVDLLIDHHYVGEDGLMLPKMMRPNANVAVGATMWEFSSFDFLEKEFLDTLSERLSLFDAIVCYDEVTQEALRPWFDGPLPILQGGFDPSFWEPVERDWSGTFRFCMAGQLHKRKDPFTAIYAFKELREAGELADAELHLKTDTANTLFPQMEDWVPGLKINYAAWSLRQMRDFYHRCHVLLAPSQGEGKNLPALEFMSTGGTVVATNWGGHRQWLHSAYSYALDYELVPVHGAFTASRAQASKEHLKELMLHLYENRGEAQSRGSVAARTIPKMCSWDAYLSRLFPLLADNLGEKGEHLRHLASACKRQEPLGMPI